MQQLNKDLNNVENYVSPPITAIINGKPRVPARTKEAGVPPTPTHIGNLSCTVQVLDIQFG